MRKSTVEIGKKSYNLTVLEEVEGDYPRQNVKVRCKCTCGNITIKDYSDIVREKAKSCGCLSALVDISGKTFGTISVESYAGNGLWNVKCSCGYKYQLRKSSIMRDNARCRYCATKGLRKSLIGKVYEDLTVVWENNDSTIVVKCICGIEKKIPRAYFGSIKSCGCRRKTAQEQRKGGKWTRSYRAEYNKQYRSDHKQHIGNLRKIWNKSEAGKAARKVARQNRRARIKASEGSFTTQEWLDVQSKYDNKCLACGTTHNITPDHVIPLSRGGSNTIDNIQPLCLPCNMEKGTQIIDYRR